MRFLLWVIQGDYMKKHINSEWESMFGIRWFYKGIYLRHTILSTTVTYDWIILTTTVLTFSLT